MYAKKAFAFGSQRHYGNPASAGSSTSSSPHWICTQGNSQPDEVLEREWRRRHAKRTAGVNHIRNSPEYILALQRSPTPDPMDRNISKRMWESMVQAWRWSLNQNTSTCMEWKVQEPHPHPALRLLLGEWTDDDGSVHEVTKATEGSFDVLTIAPSGVCRLHREAIWKEQRSLCSAWVLFSTIPLELRVANLIALKEERVTWQYGSRSIAWQRN